MTTATPRRRIVAGNWKMNTTPSSGAELARAIAAAALPHQEVDVVLCPPALGVAAVAEYVAGTPIRVGVQNLYWEESGAFTGELAPSMVAEVARFVIVGHSERRAMFGDTDAGINRKVVAAGAHGLTPILCLGESLAQRDAGETRPVITSQTSAGLRGLDQAQAAAAVIAYEPIWAIGTGRNATPAQAVEAIRWIRERVERDFGAATAAAIRIQYGGSVNSDNCTSLFANPDIDGALVGGASLDADQFATIVRAAAGDHASA